MTQHQITITGDLHRKGWRRLIQKKAVELNVNGRVGYNRNGLHIEAEAEDEAIKNFLQFCHTIKGKKIEIMQRQPKNYSTFRILPSKKKQSPFHLIKNRLMSWLYSFL